DFAARGCGLGPTSYVRRLDGGAGRAEHFAKELVGPLAAAMRAAGGDARDIADDLREADRRLVSGVRRIGVVAVEEDAAGAHAGDCGSDRCPSIGDEVEDVDED